jgi:AcrR family transcriptional regulator
MRQDRPVPAAGLPPPSRARVAALPVRERILAVSGELFARQGYRGTSTRDIAAGVGVRQPSLFHHFPSKAAILGALLQHSYGPPSAVAARLAATAGSPAARLHAYLTWDLRYVHGSELVLQGLHQEDVLGDPAFAAARERADLLHASVRRLLDEGVAAGELDAVDTGVVRELLTSITLAHIRMHAERVLDGRRPARSPVAEAAETVRLALRGLLRDPASYPGVAAEGARLLADVERAVEAVPIDR